MKSRVVASRYLADRSVTTVRHHLLAAFLMGLGRTAWKQHTNIIISILHGGGEVVQVH